MIARRGARLNLPAGAEGRILTTGEGLRVDARLVDGPLDQKLWAASFDGEVKDLDELERRIGAST